ncbi:MAG: arsenic resistance protein [Patescibacteria group bacterium]
MSFIYSFVQKYLFWLILSAMILGLLFLKVSGGYNFTPALCALAALIMIYPSLVPLDFDKIKEIGHYKKLIFLSIIINFLVAPILAVIIGWLFLSNEPMLWLGLILLSILPGGGMVTTWAYKSKANMPLTVGIVFANLLAAVVLVPFYLTIAINKLAILGDQSSPQSCVLEPVTKGAVNCLFDGSGGVSPLKIALPILIIIIIPLLLAYFTQKYLKKKLDGDSLIIIKKKFAAFSNLGLIVMLFALMGIKENEIIFKRPDLLIKAIVPLIIFYAVSLIISLLLYKYKKGSDGRAMAWGTYLRYITLALGLAISLIYQNPDYSLAVIVVILAYLIQIPSSFWLAKKFNN